MEQRKINAVDLDDTAPAESAPEPDAVTIHEFVSRMRKKGRAQSVKRQTAASKAKRSYRRKQLAAASRKANRKR